MRVLIIEDEPKMSALLRDGLEGEGHFVTLSGDGADLRRKLDGPFDRKLLHTVRGVGFVLREEE